MLRRPNAKTSRGYTLVEMLIVLSLMGILAGLMLPRFEPSVPEQLQGASQILAADLAYARNLSVTNDSQYLIQIDAATNSYVLRHSGSNNLLDVLPVTPYRHADDGPDEQTTYLEELPRIGAGVTIVGLRVGNGSLDTSGEIEFDSLGGLDGAEPITIWIASGQDDSRRYLSLTIAPVTGLMSFGSLTGVAP